MNNPSPLEYGQAFVLGCVGLGILILCGIGVAEWCWCRLKKENKSDG